jgi:hypothetical protein
MKIINEDSVLVQMRDIAQLTNYDGSIPMSVYMKLCGNGIGIIDASNVNDFIRFDTEDEIEFFKNASWILDYNEYNCKSLSDLYASAEELIAKINDLTIEYNKLSGEEQHKNVIMIEQMNLLIYEVQSIAALIKVKQGNNNVRLSKLIPIKDKVSKYQQDRLNKMMGEAILNEIKNSFSDLFNWIPKRKSKKYLLENGKKITKND